MVKLLARQEFKKELRNHEPVPPAELVEECSEIFQEQVQSRIMMEVPGNFMAAHLLLMCEEVWTTAIPTAAVTAKPGTGVILAINPYFWRYGLVDDHSESRRWVIYHELFHVILSHLSSGPNELADGSKSLEYISQEIICNRLSSLSIDGAEFANSSYTPRGYPRLEDGSYGTEEMEVGISPKRVYQQYRSDLSAQGKDPVDFVDFVASQTAVLSCLDMMTSPPRPPRVKKQHSQECSTCGTPVSPDGGASEESTSDKSESKDSDPASEEDTDTESKSGHTGEPQPTEGDPPGDGVYDGPDAESHPTKAGEEGQESIDTGTDGPSDNCAQGGSNVSEKGNGAKQAGSTVGSPVASPDGPAQSGDSPISGDADGGQSTSDDGASSDDKATQPSGDGSQSDDQSDISGDADDQSDSAGDDQQDGDAADGDSGSDGQANGDGDGDSGDDGTDGDGGSCDGASGHQDGPTGAGGAGDATGPGGSSGGGSGISQCPECGAPTPEGSGGGGDGQGGQGIGATGSDSSGGSPGGKPGGKQKAQPGWVTTCEGPMTSRDDGDGDGEESDGHGHSHGASPEEISAAVDQSIETAIRNAQANNESAKRALRDLMGATDGDERASKMWGDYGAGALFGEETKQQHAVNFWKQWLKSTLASRLEPGTRPIVNKRLIAIDVQLDRDSFLVHRGKQRQRLLHVYIDTSGSMPDSVLRWMHDYVGEEEELSIEYFCFDCDIYPIQPGDQMQGRGGTNFQIISDHVDEADEVPDAIVVFTDGYAPPITQSDGTTGPAEPDKWVWLVTPDGTVEDWMEDTMAAYQLSVAEMEDLRQA